MQSMSETTTNWLSTLPILKTPFSFSSVKTDASFRSYKRLQDSQGQTFILCQLESHEEFDKVLTIQKMFENSKVNVPKALSSLAPFILFEDLGSVHLKSHLNEFPLSSHFETQLIQQILSIQNISIPKSLELPTFSNLIITKEFLDFSAYASGKTCESEARELIKHYCQQVTQFPSTLVHKDFHWENIMIQNNKVRILDYSDALLGPPMYDLASLIADRGFYLQEPQRSHSFVTAFCKKTQLPHEAVWGMVALRLFKIIGNFERLGRDIHPTYMDYKASAIDTLKSVPWESSLTKNWHPKKLKNLSLIIK
jgi:N-acetylmuramate 1-kinase